MNLSYYFGFNSIGWVRGWIVYGFMSLVFVLFPCVDLFAGCLAGLIAAMLV